MGEIILFTDGSARPNPGKGGWGYVILVNDQELDGGGGVSYSTNNRMELQAVISGLTRVIELPQYTLRETISIHTDSTYVINGITQWIDSWIRRNWENVKNPDLWKQLYTLIQNRDITWHHVRAHMGHKYNERCDQIAGKFATG